METCMTLERKSNLVMPTHYVELDREEMSYVEGGGVTYYRGWNAIEACFAACLGVSVFKLGTTAISTVISCLRNGGTAMLRSLTVSSLSSMISVAAGVMNGLFWVRLATYGIALVAGLISMASAGNCKIGLVTVFGFNVCAFYAGVN